MPLVIPVFIPHQGCPHTCIFCNQFRISGRDEINPVSPEQVRDIIALWLARSPARSRGDVQVAFYGGSFTGLPRSRQQELLAAVRSFFDTGQVRTIRLSTRPDYVDAGTIAFLRGHGVGVVELGVQSMDPQVLAASNRGHSGEQAARAIRLLRAGGMQVGVQLMVGLPLETTGSLNRTVTQVIGLQPDFVRIYPVLVLLGSRLADLFARGEYRPLTVKKAVVLAAKMKACFDGAGIRVVRMGLQSGPELEKSLVTGPYHSAFGEMVSARLMLKQTRKLLAGVEEGNLVCLTINEKDQSIFRGVKSANMIRLAQLGLMDRFSLQTDTSHPRHTVKMTRNRESRLVGKPQTVNLKP